MTMPLQKIFFGPPGSGKSHKANELAEKMLDQKGVRKRIVTTVFHPETTYGDFTAKLLPMSDANGRVRYEVHAGPFVQALALALDNPDQDVVLIIEEINRGPCAAVFGDLFQLLDRGDQGHSQYDINVPNLLVQALEQQGIKEIVGGKDKPETALFNPATGRLRLPANLHLLGTMNTSDESVYAMDAAFKRRWRWEFVKWNQGMPAETERPCIRSDRMQNPMRWDQFLAQLNGWISENAYGSSIDDKLIGYHFLKLKLAPSYPPMGKWRRLSLNIPAAVNSVEQHSQIWLNLRAECNKFPPGTPIKHILRLDLDFVKQYEVCPTSTNWTNNAPRDNCFSPENVNPEKKASQYSWDALVNAEKNLIDQLNKAVDTHIDNTERENFETVQQVLPHHLWDNVFARDRSPIEDLLNLGKGEKEEKASVRTYGEFLDHWHDFLTQVLRWQPKSNNVA